MVWTETNPVNERRRFIADHASGHWTMTDLCARYGISRNTGHVLVRRFALEGESAFEERSRAPKACPHRTPDELEALIIAERKARGWGARKLLRVLRDRHPDVVWPARSTIDDILVRNDLVKPRRRRARWEHPGSGPARASAPNAVWTTDFKGQFRTCDGIYCYPLTIVDLYSRYLLRVSGLPNVRTEGAKPVFERLFREVGLPAAIRSDNGSPFASTGIHGLCELNTWWMKLGISHQRIRPGCPQQNGAHERMHRTLKRDTARPPAANHAAQQRRFDAFRKDFNFERPHEALDDETPGSIWVPSSRPFPKRIAPPEYAGHCEVRRVSNAGSFRLLSVPVFLSQALNGEYIGLEEIEDGLWNILFYSTLLGRFDQATGKITGADFRTEQGQKL
jgi:putative transposase